MKSTTALFLIILAVGLFYSFTKPMYRDAKELAVISDKYSGILKNIANIVETRDQLFLSYNSLSKAEIERLSKALPSNVDTVRLALDLDGIASRYGIAIKDVSIDTKTQESSSQIVLDNGGKIYETALVSISFIANYPNFRKFLEDLEKSLRLMDVKKVDFQVAESGLYEYKLLLETYWVK